MKLLAWLALATGLGACSTTASPPARLGLRLPPAELGATLSLQQQLRVERDGRTDHLEAALEIDAERVTLVGLALGQRVMTIDYDGKQLTTWRHSLLPAQVRGDDVLEDVQLTYWPLASVRAALPPGWHIEDEDMRRSLWADGVQVLAIDYSARPAWMGKVTLNNLRYGYRLTIHSVLNYP